MRVLGRRGIVASPHYLATGAGLSILRQDGSAVDAAIATNAVLAVVAPYTCGIGGDLFAMVHTPEAPSPIGLNGSGRAPNAATPERVRASVTDNAMPVRGPIPITVPGCVEAWGRLHERYGRLPWARIFVDAIEYADNGFPVSAEFCGAVARSAPFLHPDTPARETFLPDGKLPHESQIVRQPRLAQTLRAIAAEGPNVFYRGGVGREIVGTLQRIGGLMALHDLSEHSSDWVSPLSVAFRDALVYELPPNSQGVIALMMFTMLDELPRQPMSVGGDGYVHTIVEAARLAYADRSAFVTDPRDMTVSAGQLLSREYGRCRAGCVKDMASQLSVAGSPGDTAYMCAADGDGMLVSLIESNFMGIGSGVMAGETGVMLHNRGASFSLDQDNVNVIAPRKRTMHTLMPAMAFRQNRPWLVFGTMGGSAQAQIHVQVLSRLLDGGMALDEALDAPRFEATANFDGHPILRIENRFPAHVLNELERRGHRIELLPEYSSVMGHAHAIEIRHGAFIGASDPRTDSLALGY